MTDEAAEVAKPRSPKGIGAIITDEHGNVIAHAFDFERAGYGGYKLWEAQRLRAKKFAINEYINGYCYGVLASGIDDYAREQIFRNLRDKGKVKMTCVAIGHDLAPSELN